ncbi:hypothetical protein NKH77_35740 [Streptomyces sp. M19]
MLRRWSSPSRAGPPSVVGGTRGTGEDELSVAAVRVLGADVLLPSTMFRLIPQPTDLAVFRKAVHAFPPGRRAVDDGVEPLGHDPALRAATDGDTGRRAGSGAEPTRPGWTRHPGSNWRTSSPCWAPSPFPARTAASRGRRAGARSTSRGASSGPYAAGTGSRRPGPAGGWPSWTAYRRPSGSTPGSNSSRRWAAPTRAWPCTSGRRS